MPELEETPTDDCAQCGREIPVGQLHCAACARYLEKCDQQIDDMRDNTAEKESNNNED